MTLATIQAQSSVLAENPIYIVILENNRHVHDVLLHCTSLSYLIRPPASLPPYPPQFACPPYLSQSKDRRWPPNAANCVDQPELLLLPLQRHLVEFSLGDKQDRHSALPITAPYGLAGLAEGISGTIQKSPSARKTGGPTIGPIRSINCVQ